MDELDREADWNRYAYSNFVQSLLPDKDRRPTEADWQGGRDAFFAQLAITRPKQLLVVGRMQWDRLPTGGYTRLEVASPFTDAPIPDLGLYAYDTGDEVAFTVATCVYHPSSRGKLDLTAARRHVQAVTRVSCNILDAVQRDDDGWYWARRDW